MYLNIRRYSSVPGATTNMNVEGQSMNISVLIEDLGEAGLYLYSSQVGLISTIKILIHQFYVVIMFQFYF